MQRAGKGRPSFQTRRVTAKQGEGAAPRLCLGLMALAVLLLVGGSADAQGGFGAEQASPANDGNALVVGTENPDNLTVGTENPDSLTVGTQALPESTPTEALSAQPDTGQSPSALTVGTESLSDSPGGPGFYGSPEQQGQLPDLIPAAPRDIGQARAILTRAQSRLAAANTAVGNMTRRNYPTGDARVRLYDEQKTAQREVNQAQGWVTKLGGSSGGFGSE